jgi:hypothetical protein
VNKEKITTIVWIDNGSGQTSTGFPGAFCTVSGGNLCLYPRAFKGVDSNHVTSEILTSRLRCSDTEKRQCVVESGDYEFLVGAVSDDTAEIAGDNHYSSRQ